MNPTAQALRVRVPLWAPSVIVTLTKAQVIHTQTSMDPVIFV